MWMFVAARLVLRRDPARERVAVLEQREWMPSVPPITCVTAIASPIARPSPSITAATRPPRVYGSTTPRIISQRVAPSASAASLRSRGTVRKSSRATLAVIGRIMIVEHDHRRQVAGELRRPLEEGRPAEPALRNGPEVVLHERPEDEDAPEADHDARDRGEQLDERGDQPRIPRGASSVRNSAIAIASRAATSTARNDVYSGPEDEVERAEIGLDGIPRARGDEAEAELGDRRASTA